MNHRIVQEMNSIKIVIWDLDDTFWKGTLSEGGIEPIPSHVDIVGQLSRRGIINSIVSKNSYGEARRVLEQLGVWEDFVFAKIRWEAKGALVRRILGNCRLRAENALFLDDNRGNREEVKFYNPGIEVQGPEFIPSLAARPALAGKPDPGRQRLRQYQQLEQRAQASQRFAGNSGFLRQSEITVEIIPNPIAHKDRILELIQRTNQLNFTKQRISAGQLDALNGDRDIESAALIVRDRYGDYGIAGFYSLHRADRRLLHFLFSCRILHLGIERWTYSRLDCPHLRIGGEVATQIKNEPAPDWIREFQQHRKVAPDAVQPATTRILLKGGCDLQQMAHYLSFDGLQVDEELTFVGPGDEPIHGEDTTLLRAALERDTSQLAAVAGKVPFGDPEMFRTKIFDRAYDAVVYSVLMDYTRHLYRHRETGIELPYGDRNLFTTTLKDLGRAAPRWLTPEFLERFGAEFEHAGPISAKRFAANLRFLKARIPTPLIFLNGAEIAHPADKENTLLKRHREMNQVLAEFVAHTSGCYLLDARQVVAGPEMLVDSPRHYRREAYPQLSTMLVEILSGLDGRRLKLRRWRRIWNAAIHRIQCFKRSVKITAKTADPSQLGRGAAGLR